MLNRIVLPTLLVLCSHLAIAEVAETDETRSTVEETTTTAPIQAGDAAYIVDNLFIYIHSGPGKNYRILGSVDAGTAISVISNEQNDFVQIVDDKGREAWVESKFVSREPGLSQQLTQAKEALENSQSEINSLRDELPTLQQANNDLRAENQRLQQSITELQTALTQEKQANINKKQKAQHLLLSYGAAIALVGLLFGVILTLLLSRRKRYDGW